MRINFDVSGDYVWVFTMHDVRKPAIEAVEPEVTIAVRRDGSTLYVIVFLPSSDTYMMTCMNAHGDHDFVPHVPAVAAEALSDRESWNDYSGSDVVAEFLTYLVDTGDRWLEDEGGEIAKIVKIV